jgi:PAS domain-containing protein
MRRICSYCWRVITQDGHGTGEEYGLCPVCSDHFSRLWGGLGLGDVVDAATGAAFLVDADGRTAAANGALARLLGRERSSLVGLLAGEVLECRHAGEAGGCGATPPCADCPIRQAFTVARDSGEALEAETFLPTGAGHRPVRFSARPFRGFVQLAVELPAPAAG